jgi:hypothetical protein
MPDIDLPTYANVTAAVLATRAIDGYPLEDVYELLAQLDLSREQAEAVLAHGLQTGILGRHPEDATHLRALHRRRPPGLY